ncbi:MAG: tetratricopeptide repeat protein [Gemmatimonadales bacterium]
MSEISGWGRFVAELKRRRVVRVAIAYAVTAWLVVEVADTIFPRLLLPDWSVTAVILAALVGFPIAVVLAWSFDIVPDSGAAAGEIGSRRWLGVGLGFVITLLVAGATFQFWTRVVRGGGVIDAVVVLPFQNLSGDEADEYFVAGMHDALIGELAQVGSLRVISRTSATRYAGMGLSLPEIARGLDVQGVIEGSVRREGDVVEIRVQLVEALPEERPIWSQVYTRNVRAALAMHGEIARAIAQQVEAQLTPREEARLARAPDVDPETFEAYLRGMHLLHDGEPQNVQEGLRYLHTAVERNPADALAYTGLAYGYVTVGHGPNGTSDAFARAGEAAERAVALDPDLAEAHAVLAQVKYYLESDWAGAEASFTRANELNPSLASNRYHHAWFLATLDRLDEAIVEHRLAKRLDPLTPVHTAWLGGLYLFDGRPRDALPELEEINTLVPTNFWGRVLLGETYMAMGMPDSAIAIQTRIAETQPRARWLLARNLAAAGRSDEARRIAAELEAAPDPWTTFGLGAIYATLGENDRAWDWLERKPQHAWIVAVRNAYWFEGLRDDPRLPGFLAEFGLTPLES